MKAGHCYSDVKSFIPQIVCLALVAVWFSDQKMKQANLSTESKKPILERRKAIVSDIGYLSLRLKHSLQPAYIEKYKAIGKFLKAHDNLFVLAKGTGIFVADYVSQKFNQIAGLHAEAYGSAEFRHGPLSMLDEAEKTPGKYPRLLTYVVVFLVLEDENLS